MNTYLKTQAGFVFLSLSSKIAMVGNVQLKMVKNMKTVNNG